MIGILDTIISQYANSPRLLEIISDMNLGVDPNKDLVDFYTKMWNVNTAEGYGLDVWGRIVGVSRQIRMSVPVGLCFGFEESFGCQPFGQAPFYSPYSAAYETLNDTDFRKLIMLKAMANISGCSIPVLNAAMSALFSTDGVCYAQSFGNMHMQYVFEFELSDADRSLLLYSGVLQQPSGVKIDLVQAVATLTFGFSGTGLQPFGQGTFSHGAL